MKRWVPVFIVAGLLIVGILYAFPPVDERSRESAPTHETSRTRFTKPHFVGYHEGDRQWSLRALQIEEAGPDQPGVLLLEEITEGILYQDGREDLSFRADHGVWYPQTGVLELTGDVIFWDEGVELLVSEEIVWHSKDERLVAPVRATVNREGQHAEADHLEVHLGDERVELHGNVLWTNEDGITVRAENAIYTSEELAFSGLLEPVRFNRTPKEEPPYGT